jgi:hypothetical protein
MNLKQKLTIKSTSTIQIISETQAIYSDEITTNAACLSIIVAETKELLWLAVKERAIKDAATQKKFMPIINLITLTHHKVINLHTNFVISSVPLTQDTPIAEDSNPI